MGKKKAFALRLDEEKMKAIEKWAADEFSQYKWANRVDPPQSPQGRRQIKK